MMSLILAFLLPLWMVLSYSFRFGSTIRTCNFIMFFSTVHAIVLQFHQSILKGKERKNSMVKEDLICNLKECLYGSQFFLSSDFFFVFSPSGTSSEPDSTTFTELLGVKRKHLHLLQYFPPAM